MGCYLRIAGDKFDVDKFLKTTKLKPFMVYHKGQPIFDIKIRGKKYYTSGFCISISNADFDNLDAQIRDTIKYLRRNSKYLTKIINDKTITESILDFGIHCRIDGKIFSQEDTFPSELLKIAGDLGIGICLSQVSTSIEFRKMFNDFFNDKKINKA